MVNYSQSVIYKLCCNDTDIKDIYIGSTSCFKMRKYGHKKSCNNSNNKDHNMNVYKFIRDNGGWENFSMIQIEAYKATDKRDLESKERYYIELFKPSLNRQIPTRTKKEHYNDNKEQLLKYQKEYREINKEKIEEKGKQEYTCGCGSIIRKDNKARHEKTDKHKEYINNL